MDQGLLYEGIAEIIFATLFGGAVFILAVMAAYHIFKQNQQ